MEQSETQESFLRSGYEQWKNKHPNKEPQYAEREISFEGKLRFQETRKVTVERRMDGWGKMFCVFLDHKQ
jgi:hypothetical protein